ncbi:DNA (cytosine-5)-methyltransferase CMT1-like [Lolium rigidum]|uniref:DNA (cytosine-5)-methyltransferase CMT1-like n=1 Tax=Lolium rigidum TaxID=89674 RepID=UPI001F5D6E5B|nr:DNA (cytosine-5)-methyltransferase CMT1-like [Lolium rigidum]XP_051202668.1 DNA (cytosine-5)-methyltransferase CMT1-like [Lolium perenne]
MEPPATEPRRSTRRPRTKPSNADAEIERGGKRRRRAAGKAGTRGKGKQKQPAAAPAMMVDAGGAIDDDDDVCASEPDEEQMRLDEEEEEAAALDAEELANAQKLGAKKRRAAARPSTTQEQADASESEDHFVGDPMPDDEARRRWPERYKSEDSHDPQVTQRYGCLLLHVSFTLLSDGEEEKSAALCHFTSARVDNVDFDLGDDVYVRAAPGEKDYIGRITEFFQGEDHGSYFSCRWFFRVADTVITAKFLKVDDHEHDPKRVFLSEEKDDNLIESIISKVNITYVGPNVAPQDKAHLIAKSDLYYDMSYSEAYSTFSNMPPENIGATGSETTSDISCDDVFSSKEKLVADFAAPPDALMGTATLLDLYSGCGAMSTGLSMGAALFGLKFNTKWAVDMNPYACSSLKHNHPRTEVRNEKAENYLSLLQEWEALCKAYDVYNSNFLPQTMNDDEVDENVPLSEGTFEVEKFVDICYGDPNSTGKDSLCFKVRWKTYDSSHDTWEPLDGLRDSPECIKEFVETGYRESILPLPGCVDVICGGPPCQGVSGLNRHRKHKDPLTDERNKQLVVFMDIVNYLRPKYVLMENVVDILKFADGFLGRYALSRLVAMNYQARLGMMVAGCYGLPQFRMRAFLWGALPLVVLPKFPLPTHDAINRGQQVPTKFSQCLVACDETEAKNVEKALVLRDALSDLPKVGNDQPNDAMPYNSRPISQFQRYIRLNRKGIMDDSLGDATHKKVQLFDHQPLQLNKDDYERVRRIPKKKGANFRDLKGVRVGKNKKVEFDPDIPRVYLSSGKPLVPNYAMTFMKGKSVKPFGRLWLDETVSTVVTRAEPHNQAILHPKQDRVLTVRENARLQGFPDYYKLYGPIKQKYIQVGNAVAIPVARALGYSLAQAYQQREFDGDQRPLFKLPGNFIPVAARLPKGNSGGEEAVEEE